MSGSGTPEVIPAYGEAGPEAESMDKAADRAGTTSTDAVNASEKVLPDEGFAENQGTTEVDIPARIAETAERAEKKQEQA